MERGARSGLAQEVWGKFEGAYLIDPKLAGRPREVRHELCAYERASESLAYMAANAALVDHIR